MAATPSVTGRCSCGAIRFEAKSGPLSVCVCHCTDCRRATGGPVAALAAFADHDATFTGDVSRYTPPSARVERTFCGTCGSSLAFRGDYVAGQVFVHLGIIDAAEALSPDVESFTSDRLFWMHVEADVACFSGSSRTQLNAAASKTLSSDISPTGALERCD